MPAVISEKYESREFTLSSDSQREFLYDILGTYDEFEVQALLLATAPTSYEGLLRDSVSAAHKGGGVWGGSVRYKGTDWGAIEDPDYPATLVDFQFDSTGGTQNIKQSLDTEIWDSVEVGSRVGPNVNGAINVDKEKIEGVDIIIPKYEFSETHEFEDSFVTQAYKMVLFQMTGKVNNDLFRGFDRGEVLFLGATGGKRGKEKWSLTYKFSCSPNNDFLNIGDTIVGIEKLGWQYVWCWYEEKVDDAAFEIVKKPLSAYVETVYYFDNFSSLLIGS